MGVAGADHPRRNVGLCFGTDGEVLADVERDPDGSVWLYFAVQTGLGEAVSALRVEGDSGVLPLGERPGEDVLHLRRTTVDEERITAARIASASGLQASRARAWGDGAFLLQQGARTVGEIRFRGCSTACRGVRRVVAHSSAGRGVRCGSRAELVLGFDVEPSLQGRVVCFE